MKLKKVLSRLSNLLSREHKPQTLRHYLIKLTLQNQSSIVKNTQKNNTLLQCSCYTYYMLITHIIKLLYITNDIEKNVKYAHFHKIIILSMGYNVAIVYVTKTKEKLLICTENCPKAWSHQEQWPIHASNDKTDDMDLSLTPFKNVVDLNK